MATHDSRLSGVTTVAEDRRYAEGTCKAATCRWCGSPIWIVYHGSNSNHTLEPRAVEDANA